MHPTMRCLTGFVLVGCSMLSGTAFAEEAAKEAPSIKVGYKDGLFVESADGNNRVHLQGRLQTRFTFNALESADNNHSFAVQRGKIKLEGHVYRTNIRYGFQMNLATRNAATTTAVCTNAACTTTANAVTAESTTGTATLEDYYLDWMPIAEFGIKAGQYKVPFLIQELTSSGKQQFVDRSLATGFFNFARDLGVTLHGELFGGKMNYAAFVMNGDGINTINRNKNYLTGLRLEAPILGGYEYSEADVGHAEEPQLGVGLAYAYNRSASAAQNGTIAANTRASAATADIGFKFRGWSFHGAGMYGRDHGGAGVTNWGYYGQAGYFVLPKHLEVAVRSSGAIFKGVTRNQYEYSAGLNYFIKGHSLKLQTDYALLLNARGQNLNDHRFRTQMQVVF